ncbi:neurogenin-1 [Marmota marmota marmota]|uniref:neurogenin-1 n=1 Tax=Marmota marmota marmota TaxID=9994 RepID=UPI0007629AF2|nr:neurogenin-1 [Marmota marmota marmota]
MPAPLETCLSDLDCASNNSSSDLSCFLTDEEDCVRLQLPVSTSGPPAPARRGAPGISGASDVPGAQDEEQERRRRRGRGRVRLPGPPSPASDAESWGSGTAASPCAAATSPLSDPSSPAASEDFAYGPGDPLFSFPGLPKDLLHTTPCFIPYH